MSRRAALRCNVDLTVHAVSCPGVWLPRRDDVYISVCMFGQVRQSCITSPVFPLLFHERFRFDKTFYSCYEPAQAAVAMECENVIIEVIQMSALYEGGRLLASYSCNVRDFLYPYPSYSLSYGIQDREVLLERSLDFPGISPKLEFSTRTEITETFTPTLDLYEDYDLYATTPRRSRSRSRSRGRSPFSASRYSPAASSSYRYSRPTIASISRSRSMSPSRRLALDKPFVVKKCDNTLIGRVPGGPTSRADYVDPPPLPGLRKQRKRRKSLPDSNYLDTLDNFRPTTTRESLYDDLDLELSYTRTRPYTSSLADRYYERPWTPLTSDLVSTRVASALRRNRSVERLSQLERSLDDLQVDLSRARAKASLLY